MFRRNVPQGNDATASSSLTMSMSDSVNLHIVDDIIAQARDATSFAQVHNAYTHVLDAK